MKLFGGRKASIDLSRKSGVQFAVIGKSLLMLVLTVVSLLSIVMAIHFYREVATLRQAVTQNPAATAAATTEDPVAQVVVSVEKHLLLPQGEHPQVARITDLKPLTNIPFFGNALVGDVVLVYCKTSLSVLYSPSRDKVIEVSRQLIGGSCAK